MMKSFTRDITEPCKLIIDQGGVPQVDQGCLGDFHLSWNPDDSRFYILQLSTDNNRATFKDWRNAVHYARRLNRENGRISKVKEV